jgi:hypothetical protein
MRAAFDRGTNAGIFSRKLKRSLASMARPERFSASMAISRAASSSGHIDMRSLSEPKGRCQRLHPSPSALTLVSVNWASNARSMRWAVRLDTEKRSITSSSVMPACRAATMASHA